MKNNNWCKRLLGGVLMSGFTLSAQVQLSGQLKDEKGEAVAYALVALKNTQLSTLSNGDGEYSFQLNKSGTYVIRISSLGYTPITDTLIVNANLNFSPTLMISNKNLDEVVVSSTRVDKNSGMAYTNVDAEFIKKQNLGQDAPFILNQLTGVVVNSDAGNGVGYTGLRIRGSDGTRINVTINGVPVNDAESQGTFFVDMPDLVSSANNIQLQRGVGASSNGAGAFGASINFQTNSLNDKAYANLISTAGSFNTFRNTLSAGTGLINGKFTMDARASVIKSDGYIDRAFSDLRSYYVSGAYYGKKSVLKFINFCGYEKTYQAWYYVPEDSIKKGNRTYNPAGEYTDANGLTKYYSNETDNYKQNNFQLHFIHQINQKLHFNVTGHYTKGQGYYEQYKQNQSFSNYNLNDVISPKGDTITQTDLIRRLWLDNDFAGGIFNFNYTANSRLNFILGGGYNSYFGRHYGRVMWAQYASNGEINHEYGYNSANKNDGNVYLKTNVKLSSNLNVFVDLQMRQVDYRFSGLNDKLVEQVQNQSYTFFNPKLGLSYNLGSNLNVYGSFAVANKEPNRDDFVQSTPSSRPKPEQLSDLEAGVKYTRSKITSSINVYNMAYKNQLVLNGQVNNVGAYNRVNVPVSYRRGVEIEVASPVNQYFLISANLALSQNKIESYSEYVDSSNADYSVYTQNKVTYRNTDISFSPNVVSSIVLAVKPIKNMQISFINKHVGRQYLDNTSNNSRSISPYTTFDLNFNYIIKSKVIPEITLMVAVYNLMNLKYETNGYTYSYYYDSAQLSTFNYKAPAAPTNFLAGISLKF